METGHGRGEVLVAAGAMSKQATAVQRAAACMHLMQPT